jgi:predicted phosphodiesterase
MNQDLKDRILFMIKETKMTNKEIAAALGCSERSVRRYAGRWSDRMQGNRVMQDMNGTERKAFLLFDPHIPYHNQQALDIALTYAREWDPDELILAGDFVDFKDVSHWKQDPDRMDFKDEIDLVRMFLTHIRSTFPHKKIVYIEGNHEHRLTRYLWTKAPELCRLPELAVDSLLDLSKLDIEYVSNVARMNSGLEPYQLGKLYVLHGHEVYMTGNVVNMARNMYLKTHVNTIFGHHHQSQQHIFKKLDNTHEGSWMVGCTCKLSESYMPMNNWIGGFATVKYFTNTGLFKVRNKIIIGGDVK